MAQRPAHCPTCGLAVADGLASCPRCGASFIVDPAARPPQRTALGGVGAFPAAGAPGSAKKTLLGIAAPFSDPRAPAPAADTRQHTQLAGTPAGKAAVGLGFDPLTDPERAAATIVDVPVFGGFPEAPPTGLKSAQRTLVGVARPGIAPLRPGVPKTPLPPEEEPPPSYRPLEELGATMRIGPELRRSVDAAQNQARRPAPAPEPSSPGVKHPLGQRRLDRVPMKKIEREAAKQRARSRRGLYMLGAALLIAVSAVAVALLWPSAPPLKAQVRAGEAGAEVLDLTCESCPDGTVLKLRDAEGTIKGGRASIQLPAPLAIGDTTLRVTVDRPDSGRDESVSLVVRVAYRVRPELGTLDGDKPSLQIVVDAMPGSTVTLEGEEVPLREGRAARSIDVSRELTGQSGEASAQLSRKVSFVVTPPDGEQEKGAVAVTIPILPLTLEAPGRAVVTDKSTFVLAGRTLPGAEIVVAGRSLGVTKDGTFTQTMNVSSVGTTQVEVRARMAGRAPRLSRFGVKRVTSLESAAEEFMKESPLGYEAVAESPGADSLQGKSVALSGSVVDWRVQGSTTVMVVDVAPPACKAKGDKRCLVRLVQGRADLSVSNGTKLRAFGTLSGAVSHEGATVPDIDVSFSIVEGASAPEARPGAGSATRDPLEGRR